MATTLGDIAAQQDEYAHRLVEALEAVLMLHRPIECIDDDGDPIGLTACEECKDLDDHSGERVHEVYPCMTVKEVTTALEGRPTLMAFRAEIEGH